MVTEVVGAPNKHDERHADMLIVVRLATQAQDNDQVERICAAINPRPYLLHLVTHDENDSYTPARWFEDCQSIKFDTEIVFTLHLWPQSTYTENFTSIAFLSTIILSLRYEVKKEDDRIFVKFVDE
jgi:hypothetical protein